MSLNIFFWYCGLQVTSEYVYDYLILRQVFRYSTPLHTQIVDPNVIHYPVQTVLLFKILIIHNNSKTDSLTLCLSVLLVLLSNMLYT
jgi:hypothetical protein